MPTIRPDFEVVDTETTRLLGLSSSLAALPPNHQKLVAEIILLRLFSLLENLIAIVPAKLACGASYLDGVAPLRLAQARSIDNAMDLFKTHARAKPRYRLPWTKAAEIKENVKYMIDPQDSYVRVIDNFGSLIDEIRRVRNRIAHNNRQSRDNYQVIVLRHYGAHLNHVTPGILLLTTRKQPCLLDQYIKKSRVLAKDLVRA